MVNNLAVSLDEAYLFSKNLDPEKELFHMASKGSMKIIKDVANLVFIDKNHFNFIIDNRREVVGQMSLGFTPSPDVAIIYGVDNPNTLTALRQRAKHVDKNMFSPLSLVIVEGGTSYYSLGPDKCNAVGDDKQELANNYLELVNLYVAENERIAINFNLRKAVLKIGQQQ